MRRLLVGALMLVSMILGGGLSMAATGTCDPASRGQAFNVQELSVANGGVTLTVRYGWDGVSVKDSEEGCDGPLVNGTGPAANRWAIRAVNNTTDTTYYAHTLGKRGQPRTITLLPGQTSTYTAQQAANNGYETISDLYDLSLTTTP